MARPTNVGKVVSRPFFDRPPRQVAPDLLGTLLVSQVRGKRTSGTIVEVEAHPGPRDHAVSPSA